MSKYEKQISDLLATRKSKAERMKEIQAKAADQQRTLDTGEQEEFDTIKGEITSIDKNIGNLRDLEALEAAEAATAVPADDTERRNSTVAVIRSGDATAKDTTKLKDGMGFARIARVRALAHQHHADPVAVAQEVYPGDAELVRAFTKAAVPAASTLTATWAGNLVLDGGAYFADFVEYQRASSVLGQISGRLRALPFDTAVLVQGSGASAAWTKEGAAKPVTQWTYTRTKLAPLKVATIAAATKEMLKRASVAGDILIRDELTRAVNAAIDGTFISDTAAVTDESPAGIRYGIGGLTLPGDGTVAGIRCDIAAFLKALVGNNLSVAGAFWIMSEATAIDLSMATNEVGTPAFPGVTPTGGTLAGLPVFTSQHVADETAGPVVMLVKGDEVFLGDEGGVEVSISDQASLQMDNAPTQKSAPTTPTATQVVSLWQTNSVGFLVERFINWAARNNGSVVWANVNWNACES